MTTTMHYTSSTTTAAAATREQLSSVVTTATPNTATITAQECSSNDTSKHSSRTSPESTTTTTTSTTTTTIIISKWYTLLAKIMIVLLLMIIMMILLQHYGYYNYYSTTSGIVVTSIISTNTSRMTRQRGQQGQRSIIEMNDMNYDYVTTSVEDLGWKNPDAARGNPFRGFLDHVEFSGHVPEIATNIIDISLEAYYIGLDELLIADPNITKPQNAFNWTALERRLNHAASYNRHVVLTVMCHYPNWQKLSVPQYVLDAGLELLYYPDFLGGGYSPNYGDEHLLNAIQQFIIAFGRRYDGDTRIAYIHLGLLGFWGEWHTYPYDFVPEFAKEKVVTWYKTAFTTTKLLSRYPFSSAYKAGFGLIDSSFTYETLDGISNGGQLRPHYFWPAVITAQQTNFWRSGPMGGETRPEQQSIVFESSYPNGTYQKQDFMECVTTTHTSYMAHHDMFIGDGYSGDELENALYAHSRMGYNFAVTKVGAMFPSGDDTMVQVDVTVQQIGIAPFYYPLSILLKCPDLVNPIEVKGVEDLIDKGQTKVFTFMNVPRTSKCLEAVTLHLQSPFGYEGRPIKFAQGPTGHVQLDIPLPIKVIDPPVLPQKLLYRLINAESMVKEDLIILQTGDTFDLADVGRSITIEVDVIDNNNDVMTNVSVQFNYNDRTHMERYHPYVLAGHIGNMYVKSEYLSTLGSKFIEVSVRNKGDKRELYSDMLIFDVIDTTPEWDILTESPAEAPRSMSEIFGPFFFANNDSDDFVIPEKEHISKHHPSSSNRTVHSPSQSPAKDDIPTTIHGFNTPSAPSLMELQFYGPRNVVKYHVIIPGVVALILLAILLVSIRWYYSEQTQLQNRYNNPYIHNTQYKNSVNTHSSATNEILSNDECKQKTTKTKNLTLTMSDETTTAETATETFNADCTIASVKAGTVQFSDCSSEIEC